jgi:hypothetical protein
MVDYTPYADKTIRNKRNPNPEERAYAEAQVNEQVKKILNQFRAEPKFLSEIAYRLAAEIINSKEEDGHRNQ